MKNTTARSLEFLRYQGFEANIVEYYNPWARIRKDLFGFIDIAAVHREGKSNGVLGVQSTTGPNMSARVAKIFSLSVAKFWLLCGNSIQVHAWRKLKNRKWEPLVYEIYLNEQKEMKARDISFCYT